MRNARRRVVAAAVALGLATGLSGCSLVDYYRDGGEQLWGHLSGGAAIDEALAELADVLREELGVESVAVDSRAYALPATARIEVELGDSDVGHWYDVATEITTLLDHDLDVEVDVVIRDERTRIEYPLTVDVDMASRVSAVASIAEVWGTPIDAAATVREAPDALRVSARSDDDSAVTRKFIDAAGDLRAIQLDLGEIIQWDLPGYTGTGIAPDEVLALLVDAPLALAPTVRYDEVEPQTTALEYLGIMHHTLDDGRGWTTVHVGLDVMGRFDAAPGWPSFVAIVRRALAEVDGPLPLSVSWVVGHGDDRTLMAGGIRIPADDCVVPPADPVSGLGFEDEQVADALVRAGIPAAAFSVGVSCDPAS